MTFVHLAQVLEAARELGKRFDDAGHRLYLVGGIVRDQWLDLPLDNSADLDLTTDARPDAIKALVGDWADALWTQGERFGTIGLQADGRDWEITTHRAETYRDDSRKPEVQFGDDIAVDLSRRDFTVNAMAVDVASGELIDPWHGAEDLAARRLVTPLAPEVSFSDDPLRMLRAARFAARFELEPTPELVAAATELCPRIRIVAIERIGDELERLLSLDEPLVGLRFLAKTGLLAEVLAWGQTESDPEFAPDLVAAVDTASAVSGSWQLRLAGLLLGAFGEVDPIATTARRLRLATTDHRFVTHAAGAALRLVRAAETNEPTAEDVRRWAAAVQDPEPALSLQAASALVQTAEVRARVDRFMALHGELSLVEPLHNVEPVLGGDEIMSLLDVPAGPIIGEATRFLDELRIVSGPLDRSTAEDRLRTWGADRNSTA